MLWMRVTAIASSRVSGGRIDGSRRASIVLPVPGGPGQQEVVAAGGGDRQRADRAGVAAHVGEVGLAPASSRRRGAAPAAARAARSPRRIAATSRRLADAGDDEPVDERRLARALARDDEPGDAARARALGDRAARRGSGAARRRATSSPKTAQRSSSAGGQLLGRGEHAARGREVEARADLAQVRRARG